MTKVAAGKVIDPVADATEEAQKKAHAAAKKQAVEQAPDFKASPEIVRRYEKAKVIILTAAMNDTPLAHGFWSSLLQYKRERKAELAVRPLAYRNPTNPTEAEHAKGRTWPPEVRSFLVESRLKLHDLLWVLFDVPIAATAVTPLTGLDAMTRGASAIFGHAQVQEETSPTPQNELPKLLATTGAVTVKQYSESKAGKKAEFHHTLGAVVVEKRGSTFHVRHLLADSEGGFYDLDRYYHARGSRKAERAAALVTGDTHLDRADPKVLRATYGRGGIVETLRPKVVAWHDLLDFQSDSHWNDPIERIALMLAGKGDVRAEVTRAIDFLAARTPKDTLSIVVPSNHNEHLERWAKKSRKWNEIDPVNAEFLLELQLAMVRGAKVMKHGVDQIDPLAWWAEEQGLPDNVQFLRRGESYTAMGVELGFHGDIGPNGARGSRRNLDKMGARSIIGHSHSPGIFRGTYQVGTSSLLNLSYGIGGPSSWLHTHCVVHPNSKRQLIHIIDGKWRAR